MSQSTLVITQNADVRFLGKLLGDVIREYGGEALFRRIEFIRATSVDRYRGVGEVRGVGPGLDTLTLDETVAFVRSFMLFSMLANLAEDLHGSRGRKGRRRSCGRAAAPGLARHRWSPGGGAAQSRADRAGADRASHRSDAQEHARSSQPYRGDDATARCGPHRDPRRRADRARHRAPDRTAVADAGAAARAAVRHR